MTARRWLARGACAAILAGPGVLAFFTGGYFSTARAWAGLIAWACAAIAVLSAPSHSDGPPSRGARIAVASLAGLAGWTLLSILWAPIAGSAYGAGQIAVLYLGGLIAARRLLRDGTALGLVEPIAAASTLVVIGYGLSERFLPGLLEFSRSVTADGRLEQPLTYWNAMGELAAIGLVLCARLAGDARRPSWLRAAAAAAAAPLGMGLYLSFSRGALFAAAAGFVALVVLAPDRPQLRGLGVAAAAAILAALAAAPFSTVTNFGTGPLAHRELQGAIVLGLLAIVMTAAAAVAWRARRDPTGETERLHLPRRAGRNATAIVCGGLAIAIVTGANERSGVALGGGAGRLGTFESNRYDYWSVAFTAFAHDPVLGVGAGGWAVYWLRDRPYADGATDAHSLELQTLAELGLVGVLLLAGFLGGVGLAAREAVLRHRTGAAGPVAGCLVYLAHSPLDWDWQMPAVTLVTLLLAGAVLVLAEQSAQGLTLRSRQSL